MILNQFNTIQIATINVLNVADKVATRPGLLRQFQFPLPILIPSAAPYSLITL
jgi:hypothetical protein